MWEWFWYTCAPIDALHMHEYDDRQCSDGPKEDRGPLQNPLWDLGKLLYFLQPNQRFQEGGRVIWQTSWIGSFWHHFGAHQTILWHQSKDTNGQKPKQFFPIEVSSKIWRYGHWQSDWLEKSESGPEPPDNFELFQNSRKFLTFLFQSFEQAFWWVKPLEKLGSIFASRLFWHLEKL